MLLEAVLSHTSMGTAHPLCLPCPITDIRAEAAGAQVCLPGPWLQPQLSPCNSQSREDSLSKTSDPEVIFFWLTLLFTKDSHNKLSW